MPGPVNCPQPYANTVKICSVAAVLLLTPPAFAQQTEPEPSAPPAAPATAPAGPRGRVHLELPAFDAPFNWSDGYSAPSMAQSLAVAKNVFGLAHYGLDQFAPGRTTIWEGLGIVGFDIFMFWLPFGDSWVHEEWHRAVMTHRHVDSYDDLYDFPIFSDTIAVSHELDADLVRMKREHPADFVRLPAAGIEGEHELLLAMEKDSFFHGAPGFNQGLYWMTKLNSFLYVHSTGTTNADRFTDEANQREDEIAGRDFTGMDFTAWVYDLHRPDEPYATRGAHPLGVGLDRYIRYSDLTGRERRYLHLQAGLQLLNFLDPNLIGFRRFNAGREVSWMLSAYHLLSPFGFDAGLNGFLRGPSGGLFMRLHNYSSAGHPWLPGLEAEGIALPVAVGVNTLYVTPRVALWLQPERQRFEGTGVRPGALIGARAAWPLSDELRLYVEADAKTAGWVPGNVYLDPAVTGRIGAEAFVF
jgi:hypothetical protein